MAESLQSLLWVGDGVTAGNFIRIGTTTLDAFSDGLSGYRTRERMLAGTVTTYGIAAQAADGTTDFKWVVDDVVLETVSDLPAGVTVADLASPDVVSAGSAGQWEYDGGTAPADTVIVSSVGGATPNFHTQRYHANMSSAGNYLWAHTAPDVGGRPNLDHFTLTTSVAGTFLSLILNTIGGDGTTDFKLVEEGGTVRSTHNDVGAGTQIVSPSYATATGVAYGIEYDGGTAPDNSYARLILGPGTGTEVAQSMAFGVRAGTGDYAWAQGGQNNTSDTTLDERFEIPALFDGNLDQLVIYSSGSTDWKTTVNDVVVDTIIAAGSGVQTIDVDVSAGDRVALENEDVTGAIRQTASVTLVEAAAPAAGQPTMRRWGGVPHMTPGPHNHSRSW